MKIVEAINKLINRVFDKSFLPIKDKGVSPMNSLNVSLKGSLLGSVTIPSLIPLIGSFIKVNVIKESKIPGRPTPMKAACHPFNPKGAIVGSG